MTALSRPMRDRLAALLAEQGCTMGIGEVEEIAAGVAAAPDRPRSTAWMRLIVPKPTAETRRLLSSMVTEHRALANVSTASREERRERLVRFRDHLSENGLDGFIVPHADAHQSEQLSARDERLAWLTGFTGSAGTAIVIADGAALFVDGRYTVQAPTQVDTDVWDLHHMIEIPPAAWLATNAGAERRIGYDPWLHTPLQVERFRSACKAAGAELVAIDDNPVDAIWTDRPHAPFAPIELHPDRFAGRSAVEKRTEVAESLMRDHHHAVILSSPDTIAWMLNIRGGEVPYTPVALAFAILFENGSVTLFVDPRKLARGVRAALGNEVSVEHPGRFGPALDQLGADARRVRIMADITPAWVVDRLRTAGAEVVAGSDPCALPKACKREDELDGIRAAHRRDGVALCRFLSWLDVALVNGGVTEMEAAERLETFRNTGGYYRGPSFGTISAAGDHGAIVHYRATPSTDCRLAPDSLYLVDSGGQYLDGTTDVTRTVVVGTPSEEMRTRFTLVLKGHIAIASVRFPKGTTGPQIDTLARLALWQAGLDYDHGTGHGVGHYLNVHEGPQRIAKLPNQVALAPGMVVSNEPGYYKTGAYGIRIENLVVVIDCGIPEGGDRDLLGFETLTLAPIDLRLIKSEMLTAFERRWLNEYHARVRDTVMPIVDAHTAAWLDSATRTITA